jgi:WD40 repeat protein
MLSTMNGFQKITSFVLDSSEKYLLCGTLGGSVVILTTDSLSVISRIRTSVGSIEVIAIHPSKPLAASLAMDHSITLIDISQPAKPKILDRFCSRDECAENEYYENIVPNQSLSQALCFHPTEVKLATRTGNGALLELEYKDFHLVRLRANRLHDTDLITTRYVSDGQALLSGAGGDIVLSREGKELARWSIGERNHHWFEPLSSHRFLVACDELHAVIIDINNHKRVQIGPKFMRDDFEHVTYNPVSKQAFASGFDGDIYQLDPDNLEPLGIVWRAPYKLRWIKTLPSAPHILMVHSFNGAIYRYNMNDRCVEAHYKQTPHAIWSCSRAENRMVFAGEGPYLVTATIQDPANQDAVPNIKIDNYIVKQSDLSYTKRLVRVPGSTERFLLGQKNGRILEISEGECRTLLDCQEEIRDITYSTKKHCVYACTERGRLYCLDVNNGQVVALYSAADGQPQWSLALNEEREVIALAGRRGELQILNANDLSPTKHASHQCARPKRMKWLGDELIFVQTDELKRFSLSEDKVFDYVSACENTIEDFIWDLNFNYLVLVCYKTELVLCDLSSGQKKCVMPDQADFSKGLEWISQTNNPDVYPLDFLTFGRMGMLQLYRIHNDRIFSLGSSLDSVLQAQ